MTRDEARALAALMLAYADGKTIQIKCNDDVWRIIDAPAFTAGNDYRIKPEPKEMWVNEYKSCGLAYDTREEAGLITTQGVIRVAVHYREVCDE